MTWRLPKGRFVVQRDDNWTLYDSPGFILYSGDAAGLASYLEKWSMA